MPPFSDLGIGQTLSPIINNILLKRNKDIYISSDDTLMGFADFSGEHRKSKYETYSFFFCGQSSLLNWYEWQKYFRINSVLDNRKMAYKSLNDYKRQAVIDGFLHSAGSIVGIQFNVAFPKKSLSIFEQPPSKSSENLFKIWKKKTAKKVINIINLYAYFAAGLSNENQNVMLFVDNDSITDNLQQHTLATDLLGSQILAHSEHNLGHFRLGTAKSDNGSLQLEDLLAIPDLAAGAFQELLANLKFSDVNGEMGVFQNSTLIPNKKSKKIGAWLTDFSKKLITLNLIILPHLNGGFRAVFLNDELDLVLNPPW